MHRVLGELVSAARTGGVTLEELVTELRKQFITAVLRDSKGNQCKAAEQLMMHRNTFSRTIRLLQIDAREIRNTAAIRKPVASVPSNVERVRGKA